MIPAIALATLSLLVLLAGGLGLLRRPAGRDDAAPPEARAGAVAELKRLVLARQWRRALPSLLVIAGLLGVMLFGSIALLLALEQKTTGLLMLAVAVFAAARLAVDFARA